MARKPAPLCYSYQRFSSPQQRHGDSLDRQQSLLDAWVKRKGLTLDETLVMVDSGVSAFRGRHRSDDRTALSQFLELVRRGRVPRGSFLVLEQLDRLSRESIRPALTLLLNLIDAGVKVVQLSPVEQVFDDRVEPMQLLVAIMELARGHGESLLKSQRVGSAWRKLKAKAASQKVPITSECPAWLVVEGGKFEVRPGAPETVRSIYQWAAGGAGINAILGRLRDGKVPPLGDSPAWARATLAKLLNTRRVCGEYQPRTGTSGRNLKPDGPPVPDFYPRIISEELWEAARYAIAGRRMARGPVGKNSYLWSGLLYDARDGSRLYPVDKGERAGGVKLLPAAAKDGRRGVVSFPLRVFEGAILAQLKEVRLRDVRPGDGDDGVEAMTARRAALSERLERIQSKLTDGDEDVGPLVDAVRKLQGQLDEVNAAVAAAEGREPIVDAWREVGSLADAAEDPESRPPLRAALRRLVESIYCLFVGRGMTRLACCQIWFRGGRCRSYLIVHTPRHGVSGSPARTVVRSMLDVQKREFDLRVPAHAAALEKLLAKLPVHKD